MKSIKTTRDNLPAGVVYARIVKALCVSILCTILIAGLWPFQTPRNEVDWLNNENGLHFGRYGSILSSGAFQADGPEGDSSCSLEVWLQPDRIHYNSTILAFDSSADPRAPFALRQFGDSLALQRHMVDQQGITRRPWFKIENVFRKGKRVLVTITAGKQDTAVYVDGVPVKMSSTFGLSSRDLTGRLVVANSTVNDSWPGQLHGLAIYHRRLTPAEVVKHYESWSKNPRPVLSDGEPAALYLFNEGKGDIVHNQIDPVTDLVIPAHFFVLHPAFLSSPWRDYRSSWSYWSDIGINIAGFIPLGFLFAAYFSSVRGSNQPVVAAIVVGLVTSLSIEALQTLLPTRSSGTTDIITNTLGTAIGAMFYRCSAVQTLLMRAMRYAASFPQGHSGGKVSGGVEVEERR